MYISFFKPLIDFLLSSLLILFMSPLILIIYITVFLIIGRPVIFTQLRPGKNEKIFKLFKFRTMSDKRDSFGELLSDSERLTKLGLFLRKTSLDELPQLFNVLKGDLSLIGPRPLLIEYLSHYNKVQKKRHNVKPGITGWAQVNGRNVISWEEKFDLDAFYVDNLSFLLDLKILVKTIIKVFQGSDIYSGNGHTMEKFEGKK
jgi:lipopolysaccharide/colanic/teichoic acid biosynthesis glycosyltransferase